MPPFSLRSRSPDGAAMDCGDNIQLQLTTIYRPERMKGWVGLVGWPIANGLPTQVQHVTFAKTRDDDDTDDDLPLHLQWAVVLLVDISLSDQTQPPSWTSWTAYSWVFRVSLTVLLGRLGLCSDSVAAAGIDTLCSRPSRPQPHVGNSACKCYHDVKHVSKCTDCSSTRLTQLHRFFYKVSK